MTTEQENLIKEANEKTQELYKNFDKGFLDAEIQKINITTNWVFYSSEEYEERQGYAIYISDENSFFLPIPDSPRANSKLMRFVKKYGTYPQIGMNIQIDISGDYDQIKL